jgi:hypothetical protein
VSDLNPFLKYKAEQAAGNPFAKYGATSLPGPTPTEGEVSTIDALWEGLKHGAGNIGMGAARLGAHLMLPSEGSPLSTESIDRAGVERQQAFEKSPAVRQHPYASRGGEIVGEIGTTLPLAAVRSAKPGIAALWDMLTGATAGGVGAASSAPPEEFGKDVSIGALTGGTISAGMGAGGRRLRGAALGAPPSPMAPTPQTWTEAARMLNQGGVRLSPGQAMNMSERERSLQTWPILRGFVRGAVGRSLDDFDRATVAQALEPIGAIVPRSVKAGHDLTEFATKQLSAAYDNVLPHVSLARQPAIGALQADPELAKLVSEMAPDDVQRFLTILQSRFLSKFDQTGTMKGDVFKKAESDLSRRADTLSGGQSNEIGLALKHALGTIRDELATQNPRYGPELQKINQAYSMFARVRTASVRDVDAKGKFTPHDLLQALKSEDPSAGNSTFSRGRAPMQAFAEAGNEVIGPALTNRMLEPTHSAARFVGDIIGGAAMTPAYLAARGVQAGAPGVGRGLQALGPGASFETGRALAKPGDLGPLGGTVTNAVRIEPPAPRRSPIEEYIEPPPQ